jgi:alpha-amylase/alpha-mannosidase (GH57 family)
MHQPFYEDLVTREHVLPWVRLHALKDYYGMVALLREFPTVRVTFNLVPSLLVQLEAFAENRAQDRFLELSLKPAAEITAGDAIFMVENFFHAQRQRMIDVYPRYAELLARRGGVPAAEAQATVRRFGPDDLRDLQVWQKLAWIDPIYLDGDPRVRGLVAKGRGFTEEDKGLLREVELELLNKIIPEYRAAAARGQIELSTSPFYHPILPLLCDTDIYLRTHPESPRPRRRFMHPEDAAEHLRRAVTLHERLFGQRPVGLWPSEGSVSDAVVPLAAAAGFTWMATDELVLARTLGIPLTRDEHGHLNEPEHLYTGYDVRAGGSVMTCVFRDHVLSDLIGFTYAGWGPSDAAQDFVGRLAEAGRRFSARTSGREALIAIVLDGENAWEHFAGGGRPFLRALYGQLAGHPELKTVTMAEACRGPRTELAGIFPGSWIDANFYIWIGHADDRRAWGQLADARAALDQASGVDPGTLARAREEILIAEGSDWFWWYGDDHSSAHDREFDDLFRRHLRNVYTLVQRPIPDELFASNISTAAARSVTPATALLAPTLDGEETSYFEWLGAGTIVVGDTGGAMQRSHAGARLVRGISYGFDARRLFVRLDAAKPIRDLLNDGYELSLKFVRPPGVRFSIRLGQGRLGGSFWDRRDEPRRWVERGPGGAVVAAGTILEAALPLADLGVGGGATLECLVAVYDRDEREVERHPGTGSAVLAVPDERFEARTWSV